jgi:hypothetical protein
MAQAQLEEEEEDDMDLSKYGKMDLTAHQKDLFEKLEKKNRRLEALRRELAAMERKAAQGNLGFGIEKMDLVKRLAPPAAAASCAHA